MENYQYLEENGDFVPGSRNTVKKPHAAQKIENDWSLKLLHSILFPIEIPVHRFFFKHLPF